MSMASITQTFEATRLETGALRERLLSDITDLDS
jgi:hypothetical protein